jgi:peptidoglycan/LPS O-acetylase OafA/YrhL
MTASNLEFRPDINGLRAIAVISVVVFHINNSLLSGGFSGVDVFFVISGFLMTKIIYSRLDQSCFKLFDFYASRCKRIVPGLLFLCLVVAIYGWIFLTPIQFKQLGLHISSSLLFISNLVYSTEVNYFDQALIRNWLLHTWSLSVEWQFYIVYPLILIVLFKIRNILSIKYSLVALTVVSLLASLYLTDENKELGYYSLYTRAWELLLGAIAFIFPLNRFKYSNLLNGLGYLLVVCGFFLITKEASWPGVLTLIPTVGTYLIIATNIQSIRVISNPIVQSVGTASYSIYLMHWPIVLLLTDYFSESAYLYISLCFVLSVSIGILVSKSIENILHGSRFNNIRPSYKQLTKYSVSITYFIVLIFGASAYLRDGYSSRYLDSGTAKSDLVREPSSFDIHSLIGITNPWASFDVGANWSTEKCFSPAKGEPITVTLEKCYEPNLNTIFLWGDSIAASYLPGVRSLQRKNKTIGVFLFADGNGTPFFDRKGESGSHRTLLELNNERLEMVRITKPSIVVITWMMFGVNGLEREDAVPAINNTVNKIKQVSKHTKVKIIGPVPMWGKNLIDLYLDHYKESGEVLPIYNNNMQHMMFVWDEYFKKHFAELGIDYISAMDVFCKNDECMTRVGNRAEDILSVDNVHPTPNAAAYLFQKIEPQLLD